MNLKKISDQTYVLIGPTNIGFYIYNDNWAVIIDTGMTAKDGEEIALVCEQHGWQIKMIINTHAHPDHIGGNKYLQDRFNIPIYANKVERILLENPFILSAISYGGYPMKELLNPYLMASPSISKQITNDILPEGLTYFSLTGHNQDMIGIKTTDGVYFLGDALIGENILEKIKVQFTFDVYNHLLTLKELKQLKGYHFIPSHGNITDDIKSLAEINEQNVEEMIYLIQSICTDGITFDQIMKNIFDKFHMRMTSMQYNIVSTTIKSYLSYMLDNHLIKNEVVDNLLLWKAI